MESGLYTTRDYEKTVNLPEFIQECVDIPRIRQFCKTCPNYCNVWSCPEHAFDPMLYWKLFSSLTLYGRQIVLEPSLTDKEFAPAEQAKLIQETFFAERKRFLTELREMEDERSISLHVGCCDLCGIGSCARRLGKPCRHPKDKRFSMESLGADAIKAADQYFGVPLCWPEKGKLPAYFMLVCGMLRL